MWGKSELGGEGGLFRVAARTPHVWRDRKALPPPDGTVNGGDAWTKETLLWWSVRTGRVQLLRDPEDRAAANRLRAKANTEG